MKKFTPLALLCGLSLAVVGCDSVAEEQNETQNAVVDGLEDDGVIGEDDAEEIRNEQEETIDQMQDEADDDVGLADPVVTPDMNDPTFAGDGDFDGDVDTDLDNDGDGDAEAVIGSDGL